MSSAAAHSFSTGSATPPDPLKSNNNDDYDDKKIDVAVTQTQPGLDMVSQARNALRDRISSKPSEHDRFIPRTAQ